MALTTNQEIRLIFELATMRREAEAIRTAHQWNRADRLMRRCAMARYRENTLYDQRYQTRVEFRRLQLVDEAGAIGRGFHPAWGGSDRFSPEAVERQAQRDIRNAHERRMTRIDQYEHRGLTDIIKDCRRLDHLFNRAVQSFERVADRRREPDRRQARNRDH